MTGEAPDALLVGLTSGDREAITRLVREYEPYLRMVVRRRLSPELRSKFDAADVV